jgi:hypothetical protein
MKNKIQHKQPQSTAVPPCDRCLTEAELTTLAGAEAQRWTRQLSATVHNRLDDLRFQAISTIYQPARAQGVAMGSGGRPGGFGSALAFGGFSPRKLPFSLAAGFGLFMGVLAVSSTMLSGGGTPTEVCLTCEILVNNLCPI